MMKITGLSHLFKWENLHNLWLTKYFFAPLYIPKTVILQKQFFHLKHFVCLKHYSEMNSTQKSNSQDRSSMQTNK